MKNLTFDYEDVGDVLYITTPEIGPTKNIEEIGLVLRYDLKTNEPVGATVLDYKEYWLAAVPRKETLVNKLADFFQISRVEINQGLELVKDD